MSLFDKYNQVSARHDRLVAAGRDPFNICMDRIVSATEAIVDGREVILVGTNNYLGLTFDPDCIESTVAALRRRSEEHTSELQSLMRISYAVFCLKKKIIPNTHQHLTLQANFTRPHFVLRLPL